MWLQLTTNMIFIENICRWKVNNVIQFWLHSLMDDNVINYFCNYNNIFYHMNKETYVIEHGVTGQCCRSDPDLDFVCTSTWLVAHYFSSLRQCMAATLVWSWKLTTWGGRHEITATEVLAFMVWGGMAAPEWAFMMEVSGNWRWDPGSWTW